MTRVAVTGLGVVSPIGLDTESFWAALCRGDDTAIRPITRFDTTGFPFHRGGSIADGFPLDASDPADAGEDIAVRFMLAAAGEAMAQAAWPADGLAAPDAAVVLSTNFGAADAAERAMADIVSGRAPRAADVARLSHLYAADRAAARWGLAGPRMTLSLSCSSGAAALAVGLDLIRAGRARFVLTGGFDSLSRFAWSGLGALRTLTAGDVRPFDRDRDGTIFSEGAGALVLESFESARARGAPILAELAGAATGNNAHHMTAPARGGYGSVMVMRAALADAGLPPEAVDHVNAHGTATRLNDSTETEAIRTVFGARAASLPVTSIKGTIGHMMGAAGSVEAIASVLSLRDGRVPPTLHYRTPDPQCDLPIVAGAPLQAALRVVVSNSAGIGGCNAAVVFAAVTEEA